jgi:chorismate synthase
MSPDPGRPRRRRANDVNAEKEIARNRPLTRPRPGHADLVGMQKYGFDDARPCWSGPRPARRPPGWRSVRWRPASSTRPYGIRLVSHTVAIGTARVADDAPLPTPDDVAALDADPVRTLDAAGSAAMVAEVEAARTRTATPSAGVVEVLAYGLPPGLGSHVHWDRRLDARLAGALMGIQAIKGVEVGDGFRDRDPARLRGPRRDGARGPDGVIRAAPAGPAAPRAACRPARCCGCGPR